MPQVIIPSDVPSLDGSIRSQAYAFIDKLRRDDTLPGLHIEPMEQAADERARTGRVSQFWRAVLIKLTGSNTEPRYVYLGTYPHDDAISYARSVVFQRNPHSGLAEVIRVDLAEASFPGPPEQATTNASAPGASAPDVVDTDVPVTPVLQQHGITFEHLIELGISVRVAHEALSAPDQDQLLEVALAAPSAFQTDALLMLGDGTTIEQVRATYDVGPVAGGTAHDTDDDLIEALDHPASRMQFTYLEDDDDLRAAIEDEDFGRWRVFLHPEQRQYAEGTTSGAFRLSGGAGTGKTVVLLHRARHLHHADPRARIVLTTFNKTLAGSLRANLMLLDKSLHLAKQPGEPGIFVGTVDAISWRLISRAGDYGLDTEQAATRLLGQKQTELVRATEERAWNAALRQAGAELPGSLRNAGFFAEEYGTVVVPGRIVARDEYLRAVRRGRGVALARGQRNAVWDVIEAYRAANARASSTDYDEKALIATLALDAAAEHGGRRVADHVLVDEAQDLAPARLVLLRALAPAGPDDLFLAEDAQQRIYAPPTVLSRHGIRVTGRSRRLRLNYRTTAQNLDYATGILAGQELVDLEEAPLEGSRLRSARSGPPPVTIGCTTLDQAYDAAARTIRDWLADGARPETIAVLVRTGNEATALLDQLVQYDLPVQYIGAKDIAMSGRVAVMTMHRSKGMEFRDVLVFGATAESTRSVDRLPEGDRHDALQRERSLMYVATTRARDRVTVVWDGIPSELLPERRQRRASGSTDDQAGVKTTIVHNASKGERDALAREMHDTVGHSLAEIALRVSALEVSAQTDPAVRETLASIRATVRRAGDELRGVLSSLRSGAEGQTSASFDDLAELLTHLKVQGARITSSVFISDGHAATGDLTRACYRIVQESVTNALKHADGLPIDITLRAAPAAGVTIVVQNPLSDRTRDARPAPGQGSGIVGMTERAVHLGGVLSAGPVAGQFVVDARLPWVTDASDR